MGFSITRTHEICCGHRVYGHESKCANMHGHNYVFTMNISGGLDSLGRVMDFSVVKAIPCQWLEDNWDHRFLIWDQDPLSKSLPMLDSSVVIVPFNPTAENMAFYMCNLFPFLDSISVQETSKCSATYENK